MAKFNDIDMTHWKDYDNILTDSLWLFDKRDNSGVHTAQYHGNFIPQIPFQLFQRYTKKGDFILDPFAGSGTSLIEAQRLNRNSLGIELQPNITKMANNLISIERNPNIISQVYTGDSRNFRIDDMMKYYNIDFFQFIIFHPPYWDIIKFSDNPNDLSNSKTSELFLSSLSDVIDNSCNYLEKNRYCALIIGDKYANSEIVPLGFMCMNLFLNKQFKLKAILVKNFEDTKGKINKQGIWRYRALSSDFYIFKHEYIMIFKKVKC